MSNEIESIQSIADRLWQLATTEQLLDLVGELRAAADRIAQLVDKGDDVSDDEIAQMIADAEGPDADAMKLFTRWFGTYDADAVPGYYPAAQRVIRMAELQLVGRGVVSRTGEDGGK